MSADNQQAARLPGTWAWTTVGELVANEPNAITDGPFGSNLKTEHYTDSGPRVIRLQNIGDASFRDVSAHISDEHYRRLQKHAVFEGDIVIAAFGDPAPRACIVPKIGRAIVKADCIRFRPTSYVDEKYVMYALNSPDVRKETTARIHGVGRPRINLREIKDIRLPLAPASEQKRIRESLDRLLSDLDQAVAAIGRGKVKLNRYCASVLKAACEGRLVPTEAELARKEERPYDSGEELLKRILIERRAKWEADQLARMIATGKPPKDDDWKDKYREPEPADVTELPSLPDGWAWATAEQLFSFITSGSRGWAKYYCESGFLFLRMTNLNHGTITLDLRDTQRVNPPPSAEGIRTVVAAGDLLVSITADVGMTALVPPGLEQAYVNQHVALCRPVCSSIARYVAWFFASPSGRAQLRSKDRGATKMGLGLDDIREVTLPLPPEAELSRITATVEESISTAFSSYSTLAASTVRADRLRQSILKFAFEGKLVPQDPAEEPAFCLVEKIRARRAAELSKNDKSRRSKPAGVGND